MTIQLSSKALKRFLKKYFVLILLASVLCGMGGVFVSLKLTTTSYSASGNLVQNDSNYNMMSSYEQYLESKSFQTIVAKKLDSSKLKSGGKYNITLVSGGTTSPFFSIKVTSSSPTYSEYVTTVAVSTFVSHIGQVLSGSNVSVVSDSSTAHVNRDNKRLLKIGILTSMGVFIVLTFILVLRMFFTGKIPDDEFIEDVYQIKHLGTLL